MTKKIRPRITEEEYNAVLELREGTSTEPNDYNKEKPFVLSAYNSETGGILNIEEYCKKYNLNYSDVTSYKFLPHHYSHPTYNIVFRENILENEVEIDFDSIVEKYLQGPTIKNPNPIKETGFSFDRLVYSDVHIGMDTNKNGYSLYGGKWDEEEILHRLDLMIMHVLENKKSNVLIIDELGDFLDGYDGETVRKGHKLPQNMDNEKAFDTGLYFKCKLLDSLASEYDKVICNNICNDNHAGSFGYLVNSAFKSISNIKYSNVEVKNIRKFIDHYFYGNKGFILTHGKDGKNLKFGFKPILDPKQIEKIKNYIDEHYLLREGVNIEFSKGDSHQKIFDESTSDSFDYYNYPAFSPSSEWVQTNFKRGQSGFEFFNYRDNGQKIHNPYLFDWNTNRKEITIDFSVISA